MCRWIDGKMSRETLRCVSCILLAVLAVLLTDVSCEEQGKICGFEGKFLNIYDEVHRTPSHFDQIVISLQCRPCVFRFG